jgi:hypothetical protein
MNWPARLQPSLIVTGLQPVGGELGRGGLPCKDGGYHGLAPLPRSVLVPRG